MPEHVSCNLCGADNSRKLIYHSKMLRLPDDLGIVKCEKCGLRYLSPRPTVEEYAAHYSDTAHYQPEDYLERIEGRASFYNHRLDEFEAMGLNPGSILEVGCATGHFLSHARLRGWNPIGLEISPTMAEFGRERLNLEIIISDDIKKAGFSDEQFDIVYASNVLEHILDPTSFLCEVNRILKSKGTVFIEVPNQFRHLREILKLLMYIFLSENYANKMLPFPFDSIHHCYFFSPYTLNKILEKTNYKPLSLSTYTPAYFRKEFFTRRWGGMNLFNFLDDLSNFIRRGLLIKAFAQKNR